MQRFAGSVVTLLRGEQAILQSQRTVIPAARVYPHLKELEKPEFVARLLAMLQKKLGEPSFVDHKADFGPVCSWIVALKHDNGIVCFEGWPYAPRPKCKIYVDRHSPLLACFLRRVKLSMYLVMQ